MNSETKRSHILPRDAGAAPLDFVIGVMAFLAALALGGVLVAERTAEGWQGGLAGRFTVQILPENGAVAPREINAALETLRASPGIARAEPLDASYTLALVEPWLGRDVDLSGLGIPQLIDVVLAPGANVDIAGLTARLKRAAPHALLDDHRRWVAQLRNATGAVVWGALAVLALIAAATAATVAFATRAGLAAHRDIVQLLHLMGAQDRFIARAFERHYFVAALAAACGGGALAALAFFAVDALAGAGFAATAFLPPLGLAPAELPWLLAVPAAAAIIAWSTARLSVFSALKEFY